MAISHLRIFAVFFALVFVSGCTSLSKSPETSPDLRLEMVQYIVNFEKRVDAQGRIRVYMLDPWDGGGTFEVAGVNDKYHYAEAWKLRRLVEAGKQDQAERQAVVYIAGKTDFPSRETDTNAIKFLLRDIAWNRGPTGAVKTLQIALGVRVDGKFGPNTRHALRAAEKNPQKLIEKIELARETYERSLGRDETSIPWAGLVNRWKKASYRARKYL